MAKAREGDPILQTERYLLSRRMLTQGDVEKLRSEIQAEVTKAADEADAAPEPEVGHVTMHIYSDKTPFFDEKQPTYVAEDTISMVEALNRGLKEERSEEHTSELQSQSNLVCRLLL